MDDAALRSGLMGHQPLAQQVLGRLPYFILAGAQLDTTRLAPGSGVDLSLDGPASAADFRGAVHRLLRTICDPSSRNGDAKPRKQLLGLIFVDVHGRFRSRESRVSSRVNEVGPQLPISMSCTPTKLYSFSEPLSYETGTRDSRLATRDLP
jgi:hypothetical protein